MSNRESNTEQGQSQQREEGDFNMIELYFDLERASFCEPESDNHQSTQSSSEDNIVGAEIPGFTPFTGRKEDPYGKQLEEALKQGNHSGGRGPFVFPHSPDVFMGCVDKAAEQLVETVEPTPPRPRIDYSRQNPWDTTNYTRPNIAYNSQRVMMAGITQRPVIYNHNLSLAYGFQNQAHRYIPYHPINRHSNPV
ncbi:hypothetical protein F4859DRAFT_508788 [Xylaria cf. heliscus]|nr:hypothetical protein F4859DRAFT_508788 [Xylaria cf. heliscus]